MTFNDEAPKFQKIVGDDKKSTFIPMNKEELEDEVLEAVAEGKEDVDWSEPEWDAPEFQGKVPTDEVTMDTPLVCPNPMAEPEPKKVLNQDLANQLRRKDNVREHTCAYCLQRLPLDAFKNGKKSNIAIAHEGK